MRVIPIFNRRITIPEVAWPDTDCLYTFKERMNLHRALKRFKGQILSEQDVSILFLERIIESGDQRYHTIATVLLQDLHKLDRMELQLTNHPIPLRLRLDGIVDSLAMTQTGTSLVLGKIERI